MTAVASTDKKSEIIASIRDQGVLPLYYNQAEEVSIQVLRALYAAGIRSVEYTNRGEAALKNFKALRRVCDDELQGLQLGIGTIKSGDEAKAFIDAGADYLISPGVVKAAAKAADKAGLLYVPGCLTPTEMIRAEALGATLVKVFPGNILGPGYISSVKELFSGLQFMVTGGVEPEEANLRGWFGAGVVAVGMGSKLITKQVLEAGDYAKITSLTQESLQLIQSIRN
jgi:2-dehydro-3-deoxyphosphogluconate aldolase/(4S)-4-hydroxy-2-oxoglutarate aldolase